MMNLIGLIICTFIECVLFSFGLTQDAPVWYLITVGFFVVLLSYLTLDVLIDVLQERYGSE